MKLESKAAPTFHRPEIRETTLEEQEVVNDSLGTVVPADSTGVDEEKETGDAKRDNFPTRED